MKPWLPLIISIAACDTGGNEKNASEVRNPDTVSVRSAQTAPETLNTVPAGPWEGPAIITALRVAAHNGYDRVVIEFTGPKPDHEVRWLKGPGVQCGSGENVAIKGTAALLIKLTPAYAHTEAGTPSIRALPRGPWSKILEIKQLCDFEADVQYLLGVTDSGSVRVSELTGPGRIIVDVEK